MEAIRKKRKLMSSRSVPGGSGVASVVGCGVLISSGEEVGVVGGGVVGCVEGGGGVGRGVGVAATVRGRSLPRTGHQRTAKSTSTSRSRSEEEGSVPGGAFVGVTWRVEEEKEKEKEENWGSGAASTSAGFFKQPGGSVSKILPVNKIGDKNRSSIKKKITGGGFSNRHHRRDQDKENALASAPAAAAGTTCQKSTTNYYSRSAKRAREKEGDGINPQLLKQERVTQIGTHRVTTALRMAKNVGESRIPQPGAAIRASFLPKPRVISQHKINGFEHQATNQIPGQRGSVKSIVESLNLGTGRPISASSTPFVEGRVHQLFPPASPVYSVSYEDVGKSVSVGEEKVGILRYYGALEGESGAWCGIEFPEAEGLNDGTVRGLRYFSCPKNHGIMAPATKVRPLSNSRSEDGKTSVPNTTFVAGQTAGEGGSSIDKIGTGGNPVANSTFLMDNRKPRADPGLGNKGDWKFSGKSTANVSPAARENREEQKQKQEQRQDEARDGDEKLVETNDNNELLITNEIKRLITDKNKRNSTISVSNNERENSKTPSPTSRTKNNFGSRLVSPTKYANRNLTATKINPSDTFDLSNKNSDDDGEDAMEEGDEERVAAVGGEDEIIEKVKDATYLREDNLAPEKNSELLIGSGKKPTGAKFALNESFINDKPGDSNNLTNILYGKKSPVSEENFIRRQRFLSDKDVSLLKDSSENGIMMNATFDKPRLALGLRPDPALIKNDVEVLIDVGINDTFLIGEKVGAVRPAFVGKDLVEKFSETFVLSEESVKDSSIFEIPKESGKNLFRDSIGLPNNFNDSGLVGDQIKSFGDSCLIDDTISADLNDSVSRSSIGKFVQRAYSDRRDSIIEAIGDSCLLDSTLREEDPVVDNEAEFINETMKISEGKIVGGKSNIPPRDSSGPYSLIGLNAPPEEEDELTPPAAPPPSKATPAPHYLMLNKQNSFEHDESLGILTPDQMAEFSMTLECSRTPSCENLTGSAGSRIAITRASASRPSDLPTSVDCEPTEGSSERTPSPEDLPLDPKPSEPPRTVPVSFVTSVTSITSLEAGYQGDGENSRPASRGADPAPLVQPPNLPAPRNDPMTDSDFFTESDADAHEEIGRGDRRAQVIDGTLFCAPGGRRCPSFTGEEMDSSGIYSDLDRRQDETHNEEPQSEGQTPDTADTESQKSQPSPYQQETGLQQQPVVTDSLQLPSSTLLETSADSNTSAGTLEATVIEVESQAAPTKALTKADPVPLKKYKMPKRNVVSKIKAMIESGPKDESEKEARRPQRTPRKGGRWDAVMSKIEAGKNEQRSRPVRKEVKSRVLQSLGTPAPNASRRSPGDNAKSKSRRTRGRQDVTSPSQETAQSSVHSSMSDISSAPRSAKKRLGSPGGSEGSALGSAQSTPRISSPRQHQPPPSSLTIVTNNTVVCLPSNINGNNSQLPAQSSVGGTNTNNNNIVNNNNHNNNNNNNNNNNGQIGQQNSTRNTPPSHSQRSPTSVNPPRRPINGRTNLHQQQTRANCPGSDLLHAKKNSLDVSRVNLEKSPSTVRKPAVPRRSSSNVAPKTQTTGSSPKDRGPKDNAATPAPRGQQIETREQSHQTDPTHEEIHLKQAEVSVQALSVIVQYLAHQLDGFSAPRLKKDCERMKTEWLEARLEAEELRAGYRRVEQELNEHHEERQRALDQLRAELESLHASRAADLDLALEAERKLWESRLDSGIKRTKKEFEDTISRLRSEHDAELERREAETDRRSAVHDQGASLRAEAESLRTVLELRSKEIASLRSENESLRRELESKEGLEAKVEALEARSEDLRAQLQRKETFERQLSHENKVLLESFHQESKHNKRLSQHNEELQWRLRQNNEVVTVLANQLATPPQRLTRSLGPESNSPDDSPPASPMVKSMVEKSDSVSWTLEIEESPEAMASRLLRRSGSSRGISPSDSRPKRARQPSTSSSSSPVGGSGGAATVSRQSSLRNSGQQRVPVVLRARSKSVSVADVATPQQVEGWNGAGGGPGFTSTPVAVARRRPRSDPQGGSQGSAVVSVQETINPCLRPQEAGGEAMISEETSASSSEDESSASSDIPRLAMELSWSESEG